MLRGFNYLPVQLDDNSMTEQLDNNSMVTIFKSTEMALMSNIGGASGLLYGFSFVKMSQVVKDELDNDNLKEVLKTFSEAVAQRGKVELNEKTMYDVI